VRSIPLKQYKNTYAILDKKYVRIQGIKQKLRVQGLDQLPDGAELTNGVLLERHGMVRTDVKPVETGASTSTWLDYLNGIPYVRASPVGESGSLTASA
jgi:hypothetical protein